MIFFSMSKGTKSFGHDKALACESRGFVYNKKGCIVLTHPQRLVMVFGTSIFSLHHNATMHVALAIKPKSVIRS